VRATDFLAAIAASVNDREQLLIHVVDRTDPSKFFLTARPTHSCCVGFAAGSAPPPGFHFRSPASDSNISTFGVLLSPLRTALNSATAKNLHRFHKYLCLFLVQRTLHASLRGRKFHRVRADVLAKSAGRDPGLLKLERALSPGCQNRPRLLRKPWMASFTSSWLSGLSKFIRLDLIFFATAGVAGWLITASAPPADSAAFFLPALTRAPPAPAFLRRPQFALTFTKFIHE
jgi:hypothetical protein